MGIGFNEIEQIRGWVGLAGSRFGGRAGEDEIVVVVILEEIEKGTYVGVTLDDLPLSPFVFRVRQWQILL
jgi:hypothetical protein